MSKDNRYAEEGTFKANLLYQRDAGDISTSEYNNRLAGKEAIDGDAQKGYYDAVIELFELDLRPLNIPSASTERYFFTNQVMPDGSKIKWRRNDNLDSTATTTYEPLPIAATGFERTTKGQIPTPELTVSNIFGTFSETIEDLDDLIGAKLVRRRTLFKYLKGQPNENLQSYFPTDYFYIERKVSENSLSLKFALASPLDLEGLQIPKRVITQNHCVWRYRGPECGYNGGPVADQFNNEISTGSGNSQAERDYNDAFKTWKNKRKKYREQLALRSAQQTKRDLACRTSGGDTFGGFNEDELSKFTFALPGMNNQNDDNKQVTMVIFQGINVTAVAEPNSNAQYRMDTSKRITTPYDNYGTGPLYTIEKFTLINGVRIGSGVDSGIKRKRASDATFAVDPGRDKRGRDPDKTSDSDLAHIFAVYDGSPVTLSTDGEYGLGTKQGTDDSDQIDPVRFVQVISAGSCAAEEAKLNQLNQEVIDAEQEMNQAKAALDAAATALPAGSSLFGQDVCGKKLSSCKLRFSGELPFGGFPGANLSR